MVTGVVLDQAAELTNVSAGAEHRLHPDHLFAGPSVAQEVHPAGVGGHRAADGGRVAGGEIDGVAQARGRRRVLYCGHRGPGAGGHLAGDGVDRPHVVEATQADHDLAGERDRAPHQPGIAALGHDGQTVVAADGDDGGDLGHVAGPHDGRCASHEAARPVSLVGRTLIGSPQHVASAHDLGELAPHRVGQGRH